MLALLGLPPTAMAQAPPRAARKVAETPGLTPPPSLLLQADRVIQ